MGTWGIRMVNLWAGWRGRLIKEVSWSGGHYELGRNLVPGKFLHGHGIFFSLWLYAYTHIHTYSNTYSQIHTYYLFILHNVCMFPLTIWLWIINWHVFPWGRLFLLLAPIIASSYFRGPIPCVPLSKLPSILISLLVSSCLNNHVGKILWMQLLIFLGHNRIEDSLFLFSYNYSILTSTDFSKP